MTNGLDRTLVVASCLLLVLANGCRLVTEAFGATSSARLTRVWFAPIAGEPAWHGLPSLAGGLVIVGVPGGIGAFDMANGVERWRARLFVGASGSPATVMNIPVLDHIACASAANGIGCVDIRDGRVLWNVRPPIDSASIVNAAAVDDSTLYYGTQEHRVSARAIADGRLLWSTDVAPAAPFLTRVMGVVWRSDTVYATTVRWLNKAGGLTAGDLVALDAKTGRVLWSYTPPTSERSGFQSQVVLIGGIGLLNDVYRHAVRAIDLTSNVEIWQTISNTSGFISAERSVRVLGDTVFAASSDTRLYAVDLHTGANRWSTDRIGGSLWSLAFCNQSILVILTGDPFMVDRYTHKFQRERILVPGDFLTSQPVVAGNTAFVTSNLGVYAFRCS